MRFHEFTTGLPLAVRDGIGRALRAIRRLDSKFQRMVSNLRLEGNLTSDDWTQLTSMIVRLHTRPVDLTAAIERFCRSGRLLHGRPARVPPDVVFGRVKSFEEFCDLMRKMGYYPTIEDARRAVRSKIGMPPNPGDISWNGRTLAQHTMWATFDPRFPWQPFGPRHLSPTTVLCSLGMVATEWPYLVFEYRVPSNIVPRIPTFCDAYAMHPWSEYFSVVGPRAHYGLTTPTEACTAKKGRPEVVHSPIEARRIVTPLQYLQ